MQNAKDVVAERVARAHYAVDPDIELIVKLEGPASAEADPEEPIKLLEINPATSASGIVPIFFQAEPARGIDYPVMIVEITPGEYGQILQSPSTLPNQWRLGRQYPRLSSLKAG